MVYSGCILMIFLFPCSTILHKDFASRVQSVLRRFGIFQQYNGIPDCIDVARTKAQSLFNSPNALDSRDSYYAVILINMFSNPSCTLSKTENNGIFYKRLNKELQNTRPRGPESKLWRKVGSLINKALEIMRLEPVDVVYRGCVYHPDFSQPEFSFRKITSTSTDPLIAGIYSDCKTFILIEDALGLDIERYSQIPDESEILLQSTNVYLVEKYTRNETEIHEEMEKILPGMTPPEVFVRLRQKHGTKHTFLSRLLSCSFGICRSGD
ncbi:uncharacterized protein LOC123548755 [Mercenaria mercenaria]|uniref:uncharacterized protein LOC123548755 n=1 Tax=Mercenaria mercenaria TaxID=6596 RepID=UPI00234E5218|nr:uncharacterized protein LOC123548755 [Mercenaria mercenaria]